MPINRSQASKLLNASELALFDAASASAVRQLSAAQLSAKIGRTRRLRDKQRDLYKRQRLASQASTGSKSGRSSQANQRTKDKAQVFDEVLGRLQARLASPAVKAQVAAAKKGAAGKKAAAKKATTKKAAAKKATITKATIKKATTRKATTKTDATKKATTKTAATKKAATKKAATKKAATKKATTKTATKTATKKTAANKATTKQAASKTAASTKGQASTATSRSAKSGSTAARKTVSDAATHTPFQGLFGLFGVPGLSPKAPVPMEPPGAGHSDKARTGFMSKDAKLVAKDRHFAEGGGKAIQGHASAQGRRNQGKRDHRGD